MAETSGFFNAHVANGEYDRVYLAEQFAKYFASFIGNGIFGGKLSELMVIQHDDAGMRIKVLPGMSWINGFWYENSSDLTINVDVSDGVVNRIDNVVVRWGKVERKIWIEIVKGTPTTNAVAPSIERNSEYYDLKIAELHINAGLTNITQANIVDTRLNNDVCGLVTGLIDQIDTSGYADQMNKYISYLSTSVSNYASEFKSFLEELELNGVSELDSLFDRLNALIEDESAFATLALKADDTASETALLSQTLGYTKKNLIPYPFVNSVGDIAEFAGITWTDLGDGTVKGNGTATENSYFTFYEGDIYLKPGKYVLTSGFDDNESVYVFFVKVKKSDGVTYAGRIRSTENAVIELTKADLEEYNMLVSAFATTGANLSNVVMKPMLRRAEILDEAWEPYRLSVAEMIQEDETEIGCFYRMNRITGTKEWLNAPNRPGIEYCLAEKWNNKPVYQKTLYAASLPNNSIVGIEVDSAYTDIVSISGYALDTDNNMYHTFPIIVSGVTPIAAIVGFEGDGGDGGTVVLRTTTDASSYQGYITVKYTKI